MKILFNLPLQVLCLATCLSFNPAAVQSEEAAGGFERLSRFQQQVTTLHGSFTQTIIGDPGLADAEFRSGQFWVQRPDRIRWHYRQPYEQLIVADGQTVWLFDPDLDQVIVRALDEQGDDVASLLLGSGRDVSERFTVTRIDDDQYQLLPLAQNSSVSKVRLQFDQQTLVLLEVEDALGVTSRFEFATQQVNSELDAALFQFQPPDGVDVVYQ